MSRKNLSILLLLLLLIVLVATLIVKGDNHTNTSPMWYNHICYGTVVSVSADDLVIERDTKTPGNQTTFLVKRRTDVYGMKGMTEVSLSEITPGMNVRIIYRETMRAQVGVAREVKMILNN